MIRREAKCDLYLETLFVVGQITVGSKKNIDPIPNQSIMKNLQINQLKCSRDLIGACFATSIEPNDMKERIKLPSYSRF